MPHPLHAFVPDPAGFDPNASVISKPFELDDSADLRREIAEAEHTEWVIDAAARRALALLGQPSAALDAATDEARAANPDLFSPSDDISALQSLEAQRDEALERLAVESEKVSDLQRQLSERDAEPPPLSPDPVKHMIPEEIRKLMLDDETLPQARQRLWPVLNAELSELKNQEALFNRTEPRRAEVEQLISILARLGEG